MKNVWYGVRYDVWCGICKGWAWPCQQLEPMRRSFFDECTKGSVFGYTDFIHVTFDLFCFWTTRTGSLETRSWTLIECCEIFHAWGRSIPKHGIHWMAGIYLIISAYKLTASIESTIAPAETILAHKALDSRAPCTNLLISTPKNTTWVGLTNEFLQKCAMQWQSIEFTSLDLVAMAKVFFLLHQDATILQRASWSANWNWWHEIEDSPCTFMTNPGSLGSLQQFTKSWKAPK